MRLLAIDPGTTQSGYVVMDGETITSAAVMANLDLLDLLPSFLANHAVIEMIACYGMPVGKETFETCVWIGRFVERLNGTPVDRMFRKDVKSHLCNSARAKDPHVWQALLDRYGPGKEKAVGCKKSPGPLYGITSHQRAALAVAVCWQDGIRSTL